MLFNKAKWVLGGALLAMLASCGSGPVEATEEWAIEADAADATKAYNEFVSGTFNLANLKVEYEYEGIKVTETIVGDSETLVLDNGDSNATYWLWKEGTDFYTACKDSDKENGWFEKGEEQTFSFDEKIPVCISGGKLEIDLSGL